MIDSALSPLRKTRRCLAFESRPPSDRIAVDLSALRPGGENGGVKPFIFEYLRQCARVRGTKITFVFLTWSASHDEVRNGLSRSHDELICVRHTEPIPPSIGSWRTGESFYPNPPPHFLTLLEIDLLYSPLGSPEFACPGIPTIATVVDVLHRDYPATLPPHLNAVRENLFQKLIRVTDQFQCISQHTASRMAHHFAVPSASTFCNHIVIHSRFALADASQATTAPEENYFLYPANSWPHKNHETLLVAFRHYSRAQGSNAWRLVLTGHEDDRMRELMETVRALGLESRVLFRGHLDDTTFQQLWQNAGALVFPSLHEGFGIPLLEAMHFGIPILCSSEGSLPEVAGDAARYVDARDPLALAASMAELANDAELRTRLVRTGKERLATFSFPAEIAKFLEKLEQTIAGPARLWSKGVFPDGWTEKFAVLGLPPCNSCGQVTLQFDAMPSLRRVRVYHRNRSFGGVEIPPFQAREISFRLASGGGCLVLEIPDASNLNADDHRQHGVILSQARFRGETGEPINLLETLL